MGTVGSWGLRWWHWGSQWSCRVQAIRRLCKRLLMIMLNCRRVNESWTVDITKFLTQSLVLYLRQTVCWNLAVMNEIIWILWILELAVLKFTKQQTLGKIKIRKILCVTHREYWRIFGQVCSAFTVVMWYVILQHSAFFVIQFVCTMFSLSLSLSLSLSVRVCARVPFSGIVKWHPRKVWD